jgi:lipopolysaccharide export system protein LptA
MFLLNDKFLTVIILLIACCSGVAQAANKITAKAEPEPIDIKAQYLVLDENTGISKYKGQVVFTKGTLIIKADAITLYHNAGKLTKAVITGSPADIQHQPENEARVHSQANKIEYFVTQEKLILKGNAFVDQGERHFSGEKIEYDTQRRLVTASGKNLNQAKPTKESAIKPSTGRVHVIIGPTEDATDAKKDITETDTKKEQTKHE